jgi:hypothetical protein
MTHNERLLKLLSDGKPHLHHELYGLGIVAHSRVSDCRKILEPQGKGIAQWTQRGPDGETDYVYQLTELVSEEELNRVGRLPASEVRALSGVGEQAREVSSPFPESAPSTPSQADDDMGGALDIPGQLSLGEAA